LIEIEFAISKALPLALFYIFI